MTAKSESFPHYHPDPKRPGFGALAGSWDTQFHAYRSGGTAADPKGGYAPINADMSAANAMHAAIGIERGVLVQNVSEIPNYDAFALDLRANPRLRGVITISPSATIDELRKLHDAGVRGIRFHYVDFFKIAPSDDFFRKSTALIADLGWHVIVNVQPKRLEELVPLFRASPCPVVINHQAHLDPALGTDQPGLKMLLALQRDPHIWVQLSAGDRYSTVGRPAYEDVVPIGRALAHNCPERVIWASDWPHAQYNRRRVPETPPDEGDLLDMLFESLDRDRALLEKVLVSNPATLYR